MSDLLLPGAALYQKENTWLAELTAKGMQLAQEKQKLQMLQQQQALQEQHWWAEQARLRKQQEFQNRKFLFDVGKDERDRERQGILDERTWAVQQAQMTNLAADNLRMEKESEYKMDPMTPANLYQAAHATKTMAETAEMMPPEDLPFGATGPTGPSLLPELKPEGAPAEEEGEGPSAELFPVAPKPGRSKYDPEPIKDSEGNVTHQPVPYLDKYGRPKGWRYDPVYSPRGSKGKDPLEEHYDDLQRQLATYAGLLKNEATAPAAVPRAAMIQQRMDDLDWARSQKDFKVELDFDDELTKRVGSINVAEFDRPSATKLRALRDRLFEIASDPTVPVGSRELARKQAAKLAAKLPDGLGAAAAAPLTTLDKLKAWNKRP